MAAVVGEAVGEGAVEDVKEGEGALERLTVAAVLGEEDGEGERDALAEAERDRDAERETEEDAATLPDVERVAAALPDSDRVAVAERELAGEVVGATDPLPVSVGVDATEGVAPRVDEPLPEEEGACVPLFDGVAAALALELREPLAAREGLADAEPLALPLVDATTVALALVVPTTVALPLMLAATLLLPLTLAAVEGVVDGEGHTRISNWKFCVPPARVVESHWKMA